MKSFLIELKVKGILAGFYHRVVIDIDIDDIDDINLMILKILKILTILMMMTMPSNDETLGMVQTEY